MSKTSTGKKSTTSKTVGPAKKSAGPKSATSAAKGKTESPDSFPDREQIAQMLAPVRSFADNAKLERIRSFLSRLSHDPPQVLLLEGGSAELRLAAVHYWAALLNCPEKINNEPCLRCTVCTRLLCHMHRDLFFLNGLEKGIKIDEVRDMRKELGDPPLEAAFRLIVLYESQNMLDAAGNALLKSFEEPKPGNSFVMTSPQRERLLPTLVSRSLSLTLPWPLPSEVADEEHDERLLPLVAGLCVFLKSGKGFFEKSSLKGAVDAGLAHALVNSCRQALCNRIKAIQTNSQPSEGLETSIAPLPEARLRILDEVLAECQDSLNSAVNPTLVVEWLATRIYLLLPKSI